MLDEVAQAGMSARAYLPWLRVAKALRIAPDPPPSFQDRYIQFLSSIGHVQVFGYTERHG